MSVPPAIVAGATPHAMPCLLLVGGGNMGGALLAGWRAEGLEAGAIGVVEPDAARAAAIAAAGVTVVTDPAELGDAETPDVIVIAVKPQHVPSVLPAYAAYARLGALILSVVAGVTAGDLARYLNVSEDAGAAIVRAMPNTPAAAGRGMTVAWANSAVTADQRAVATNLLAAVGRVAWIDEEGQMDAVTALSGSGPAYVFLLAESLAEAGVAAGLAAPLAAELARETVIGAAILMDQDETAPEIHRQRVTSPGGTTAAALQVLMAPGGVPHLLERAVDAAARRSREIAAGSGPAPDPE